MSARRRRPTYPGFMGADYDLVDFNPDAEHVEPIQRPVAVTAPHLTISPEEARELRYGLGRVDMDIRWMVWLDDHEVLHLWRSWTGFEIYRATLVRQGAATRVRTLEVETDPERYGGDLTDEPNVFLRIYEAQLDLMGLHR